MLQNPVTFRDCNFVLKLRHSFKQQKCLMLILSNLLIPGLKKVAQIALSAKWEN